LCFFFQAEAGIRDRNVTGVQTCALPISSSSLLNVNKDEEGKFTEYMNLDQFYYKLNDIMQHNNDNNDQKQTELEFNKLFQQIERSEERRVGKESKYL